jgi:hypothetical protein
MRFEDLREPGGRILWAVFLLLVAAGAIQAPPEARRTAIILPLALCILIGYCTGEGWT